jgi:radical SAM protein (TIGR01212 family)
MFKYNSVNEYYKKRFGSKVYKLSVDSGNTCPNRDGTKGIGGCIFCSEGGSGEFAAKGTSVKEQLVRAKERVKNKVNENAKYICYFQAFTNTYAPVEVLKERFFSVLEFDDIVAISIATRPDCLEEDVLELLNELNKQIPVIIELGFQTSNEETAKRINRCYDNICFENAVKKLKMINIEVVAHVILGLPNETVSDMLETVKYVCDNRVDGIKLQLLHVLKNTALEKMDYKPLTMEEYFHILSRCIEIIPESVVIHRLTGDGDKRLLIKPLWSGNKHFVLNSLNKYMNENNIIQGSKTNGQNK